MLKVRYTEAAQAELASALARFEHPDAAERFMIEILAVERQCAELPELHGKWRGSPPDRNIHQCRIKGFPYSIAYEAHPPELLIIAVVHDRRLPLYWAGR